MCLVIMCPRGRHARFAVFMREARPRSGEVRVLLECLSQLDESGRAHTATMCVRTFISSRNVITRKGGFRLRPSGNVS